MTRTCDLWTFVIAETRPCESDAPDGVAKVVLVSPTWVGELHGAEHVARGESAFVHCEVLIYCDNPCDEAQISDMQRRHTVEPLSAHVNQHPESPSPAPDVTPNPVGVTRSTSYWETANAALALTSPNDQDRAMLSRIADIGVISGEPWDATEFSPATAEAIDEGIDAAISDLMRAADDTPPELSGQSRRETDRDYFGRALAAFRSTPMVPA